MDTDQQSANVPTTKPLELPRLAPEAETILHPHLSIHPAPGTGPFCVVTPAGVREAAAYLGSSLREAMLFCLEHDIWPLRFKQNRGFFSAAQQSRMLKSHAVIIGCGGLGGHVIVLLARMGIGELTVCDDDAFEESNLNRQALCREDRMGMNKAMAAKDEVDAIASHVTVHVRAEEATERTLAEMCVGAQLLVDCLDNMSARRLVEQAARNAGLAYVHGAVGGMEGFALRNAQGFEQSLLSQLYPGKDVPKDQRAEYKLGIPAHTAAMAAVLQVLLCLETITSEPNHGAEHPLLHFDLSVPEVEILYI